MNVELSVDSDNSRITISNESREYTQKPEVLLIARLLGKSAAQLLLALSGQDGAVLAELRARFQGAVDDALR